MSDKTTVKTLERLAIAAYRSGRTWAAFWREHGDKVREAEPHDRPAFRKLVVRLTSLLVSGDEGPRTLDDLDVWGDGEPDQLTIMFREDES